MCHLQAVFVLLSFGGVEYMEHFRSLGSSTESVEFSK